MVLDFLMEGFWPDKPEHQRVKSLICAKDCDGEIEQMLSPSGAAEIHFCPKCGMALALVKARAVANGSLTKQPFAFLHDCVFNSHSLKQVKGFKLAASKANQDFRDLLAEVGSRQPENE
jgi:hypothetical protein